MKILFICPKFHDYEKIIIQRLEKKGNFVKYYETPDFPDFVYRIKRKINPYFSSRKVDNYIQGMLDDNSADFDEVVLIYGGPFLRKKHVVALRNKFNKAKFVFYNWDAVSNNLPSVDYYKLFDVFYSFDKNDCQKYGYKFLHNFYIVNDLEKQIKYDCGALMTLSTKKYDDYLKIRSCLPKEIFIKEILVDKSKILTNLFHRVLFRSQFKLFKKYNVKTCKKGLSLNDSMKFYNSCNCIIDVPLKGQNGLTTRIFEALSLKTKIITTNKSIKEYDFYTPNNIFVIEDDNTKIPVDFLRSPFDEKYSLSEKYSIDAFVNALFQLG